MKQKLETKQLKVIFPEKYSI